MVSFTKLRFVVIGAGLIGPRHARTATGSPDTELVAIELSSAGIHILVEKPFSTDIPSGKDLLQHLSTTGVKALVGHHRRFNPYMVAAKEIVSSSGKLGKVLAINGMWTLYKSLDYYQPPTAWRQDKTGGVVLINMIHEVDLLHYLMGPITTVYREKIESQSGLDAEEGAALTLRFNSSAVGSFLVADNLPSLYNFESGTGENPLIPKAGQNVDRVFGTDRSVSVPEMSVWSYKGEKSWSSELSREVVPVPEGVPSELQLNHFFKVIRGEEALSCTAQAGLAALLVCEAIRKALEGNSTVNIEPYSL
ncbi:NAD(P)-binding protein [Tilletiaria anomala UBC 951]|uniref:NAD(P)-binding protein n=1 Tax=Tilletiaria anomala (strain ATCC 24038 / CBS 436.72 / UBC 951) TaxID=1037660 RepID=A0A066VNF5_TILAU|nr:NAD(P)-binding protein [Tilletiaria anomala UBC 951]KDN43001.1 NAD(P)-binding protein [Tilletiaria anomala UBC 951]